LVTHGLNKIRVDFWRGGLIGTLILSSSQVRSTTNGGSHRLADHVHILQMNGDSYRLNQSKRRSPRASSDTSADQPTQA
jgi:hypothetical protein